MSDKSVNATANICSHYISILSDSDSDSEVVEISSQRKTNFISKAQEKSVNTDTDSSTEQDNDAIFDNIQSPETIIRQVESDALPVNSVKSVAQEKTVNTDTDSSTEQDNDAIFDNIQSPETIIRQVESDALPATSVKNGGNAQVNGKRKVPSKTMSMKQKLAQQKAASKATNELLKIYKPGECMKYMEVELHPSLQNKWIMSDLARELEPTGAKIVANTDIFHEGLVLWSRRMHQTFANINGQVELTQPRQACSRAILVLSAHEVAPYVLSRSLASHLAPIRDIVNGPLTLVVFDVKDYWKKNSGHGAKFTQVDLEIAYTDLLVSAKCDALSLNNPNELALLVVHYTKAIAEEPFKMAKRTCDDQAEYYMRGDNKKCVAVDKHGNGLSQLWQQMLAVLPHSSLETSRSLCSHYKSPLELLEALDAPNGVTTLAELGVDRAGLASAKHRKLGPEFARKLRLLLTADDGSALIG